VDNNSYRNEEVEEYGMITGMSHSKYTVGFEVFTAVVLIVQVFWDVTPC
jgi:hypothetical protein